MSNWARPGVKCVCIRRDYFRDALPGEQSPAYMQLLTVRTVEIVGDKVALTFMEIRNAPREYAEGVGECCFAARQFRPVTEPSDDVALFAHHLDLTGEMA